MTHSNKSTNPLRQRMIDDMTLRKLAPKTQAGYLRAVMKFTRFFARSPDLASPEDLRAFQLQLVETGVSSTTINATITGLKFFFGITLERPEALKRMSRVRKPQKLPQVLSVAEVERLLAGASNPKHRAALAVAYGAGLRAREVVHLKIADIDSTRMIVRVVQGKGQRDRYAMLSPSLLELLRVLSRLFRRLLLEQLSAAHHAGEWQFFGAHQHLANSGKFANYLRPLRTIDWVVYAKRPFAGPEAVLAYLSRYTHRVAIANSRLIACDQRGVTFKWKDYRAKAPDRYKTMTLATPEFIRRFLMHVLPAGFHRIRHYGLFANPVRVKQLQRLRELLSHDTLDAVPETDVADDNLPTATYICPACGTPMIIIETFHKQIPRAPPVDA